MNTYNIREERMYAKVAARGEWMSVTHFQVSPLFFSPVNSRHAHDSLASDAAR